jgi:hypothetical protein
MPQQPEPPAEQPRDDASPAGPEQPEPATQPTAASQPEAKPATGEYKPELIPGALFPHEVPSEHWDVDFGDSKQVYQGSDLPIWILAGWATFIIWALVYLYFGLIEF